MLRFFRIGFATRRLDICLGIAIQFVMGFSLIMLMISLRSMTARWELFNRHQGSNMTSCCWFSYSRRLNLLASPHENLTLIERIVTLKSNEESGSSIKVDMGWDGAWCLVSHRMTSYDRFTACRIICSLSIYLTNYSLLINFISLRYLDFLR